MKSFRLLPIVSEVNSRRKDYIAENKQRFVEFNKIPKLLSYVCKTNGLTKESLKSVFTYIEQDISIFDEAGLDISVPVQQVYVQEHHLLLDFVPVVEFQLRQGIDNYINNNNLEEIPIYTLIKMREEGYKAFSTNGVFISYIGNTPELWSGSKVRDHKEFIKALEYISFPAYVKRLKRYGIPQDYRDMSIFGGFGDNGLSVSEAKRRVLLK